MDRFENNLSCRDCVNFDPAYDLCYFYGSKQVEDQACEIFHKVEY